MPNPRVFGTEISGNRRKTEELSPEHRAALIGGLSAGQSPTAIAKAFKISRTTVYRTIKRFQERNDLRSKPRTGRPRSLSTREERYIARIARRFPRISWRALVHMDSVNVSRSTIRRILRRKGIRKWLSKRRPKLTPIQARSWLAFCRYWLDGGRRETLTSVGIPHEQGLSETNIFRSYFLMSPLFNQYQIRSHGSSGMATRPIGAI